MRAGIVATLVLFVCASALAADKPEPKYEGKPLEYWVTRFQKAETDDQRDAAVKAIKAFGPDAAPAMPTLIEMLADHSADYRSYVIGMITAIGPKAKDARPIIVELVKEKKNRPDETISAIVAISSDPKETASVLTPLLEIPTASSWVYHALCDLGPDAKDAIPAIRRYVLTQLSEKEKYPTELSLSGLNSLAKLGPDVVPLLVEMLNFHDVYGRMHAIQCLEELGPKAIKAAPALVKLLKHKDAETRYRTAVMLWQLEKNPAVVPALAGLLDEEAKLTNSHKMESNFAADAAKMLGEIGPDAKEALPALREAVAIGIPASALRGVYFYPVPGNNGAASYMYTSSEAYEASVRYGAMVTVAEAAREAIDKIEGKPNK